MLRSSYKQLTTLAVKMGLYTVRHGVQTSLDDRDGELIPCCFKSIPYFINHVSWREVVG